MELVINPGDTVLDLKQQFVEKYKGLKLELFQFAHDESESSQAKNRVLGTVPMSDLIDNLPASIEIHKDMTVAEVEATFEKSAGLHVQVFRKMRGVWIETVQTDGYTLEKQMELSKNSTQS
jgi:hypothetical protein